MKDLDLLRYFLRIEVARSLKGLSLSQRKHLTDLLKKGTLGSKPIYTLINFSIRFDQNLGEPLVDPKKYRRLIVKLIYLTVTRPDIMFIVGMLSRYM